MDDSGNGPSGPRADVEASIRQIEGMFLGGGMIRSQLASVSGVEAHDIQNWSNGASCRTRSFFWWCGPDTPGGVSLR